MARQLGTDPDTLTAEWHTAIRDVRRRAVAAEHAAVHERGAGSSSIDDSGGGRYNIGPRVSPDGKRRSRSSPSATDSRSSCSSPTPRRDGSRSKLSQSATDPHFDSLEFLNSAGAWSPDGAALAIAAMRGGRPVLALLRSRSPAGSRREVRLPSSTTRSIRRSRRTAGRSSSAAIAAASSISTGCTLATGRRSIG